MMDRFNTSTFAQQQVSITGSKIIYRQYSPRVAIVGAATFSDQGHSQLDPIVRIGDEPSNTVNKHISRVQVRLFFLEFKSNLGNCQLGIRAFE
jgi:hypothetical protein